MRHHFTSESVTEGHPDKVADAISDAILDACIGQDPISRVACETMVKHDTVILAGEITTSASIDRDAIVRDTIREIGYVDPSEAFHADGVRIIDMLSAQAVEIGDAVSKASDHPDAQGAGDQGMMFGYASDETDELMPLPILLAHRLAARLADDRRSGRIAWLRPDGKTQVTVDYDDGRPVQVTDVLVSVNHAPGTSRSDVQSYVRDLLLPEVLADLYHPGLNVIANPSGSFVEGGPSADCGLTGRKIIVDTYGGAARHGGGAFSGKDPSKVDRSGAYFARHVTRQIVRQGVAKRAELQVSYAIGRADPMSLFVETFGTGDGAAAVELASKFDFRPAAVIRQLDLLRPIYRQTTCYGHFGRPGLPWEDGGEACGLRPEA